MPYIVPPYIPEGYEAEVVDFDAGDLRKFVVGRSVRLWWEQAVPCPCREVRMIGGRTRATGEPSSTCAYCSGAGYQYVNGQQIIAALQSTSEDVRLYSEYGPYAKGTTWLTLLPEHVADYLDRYTLLDGVRTHSELKVRADTVESLRYPVVERVFTSGVDGDHASEVQRTVGVQWCMAADLDGVASGDELEAGVDFAVTAQGKIDWTLGDALGTAPVVGARYGVRYYARPRFVLDDHTYLRRDVYLHDEGRVCLTPMPVRALAMLDFLGGNPPNAEVNPTPTSDME